MVGLSEDRGDGGSGDDDDDDDDEDDQHLGDAGTALPAHQDTALVPMDRQAQDLVKALQASRFLSAVTSKRPNVL